MQPTDPHPPPTTAGDRWSMILDGLNHLDQGITIIDDNLNLVACNRKFLELFDLPIEMGRVGTPFEAFIRHNARRGEYGPGDPERQVQEQVRRARAFQAHRMERVRPNGAVLKIVGNPMPEGFVTVYTEVTPPPRTEQQLRDNRNQLEARVAERTTELTAQNRQPEAEIHSRRQTAAALRHSSKWLRLIADALPALVAYVDKERRYGFVNKLHEDWFGIPVDAIPGRTFGTLIDTELGERLRSQVEEALTGREVIVEFEFRDVNDQHRYVRSNFVPHFDETGAVLGFFNLGMDLTEHKKTQEALNQAMKMEAVGQLTGGIAHDFNNLLTIIMGNLAFLEDDLADRPELLECAETALHAAQRGAELTGRMLAYSRRQALQPRVLDPSRLATATTAFLKRTLGEGIGIRVEVEPEVWKTLADPNQLTNALLNLSINARDAMPQGGALVIAADNAVLDRAFCAAHPGLEPGDYVRIRVIDTGVGMSQEAMEKAFEPFFTTKEPGAGTGLGLSMVYGFASQSGGHAAIHSHQGKGTTVALYLPRASEDTPEAKLPEEAALSYRGNETVLLVEDDPEVRRFVARTLREQGHRVLEAGNAQAALGILAESLPVDLLLADLVMPGGVGGRELARQVRDQCPGIRVLCMSGYSGQRGNGGGSPDSCDALLNKPFTRQQLIRAVSRILERARTGARGT